jgi:transposase
MGFKVQLSEGEQRQLQTIVHQGTAKGRVRTRAQILMKIAQGWKVAAICDAFDTCPATVYNTHKRYQQGGVALVVGDRVQQCRRQALSGEEEALLVAITCSPVPEPHDHWTLRMLRTKLIELGVVERISPATVHAILKKTTSSPGGMHRGVLER